jgi:hypothetical protein
MGHTNWNGYFSFKTDRAPMTDARVKYLFDVSYYNLETFVILMLFSLRLYAFSRIGILLLADPISAPNLVVKH